MSSFEDKNHDNPAQPADASPRSPEDICFDDLIAPLSREEFLTDYWEQQPLVSRGKAQNFYHELFSTKDVDKVIVYQKPKPGNIDLVSEHGFVRDNFLNADQTSNINLVYQNYLKGSTVILSGLESSWPPLHRFCRNLEGDISHPVAVAVYLTPPDIKGVKPHYDTQDGFLIQIDGSKKWKVYKPVHQFPPVEGSYTSLERNQLSKPILETTLEPGDVMYIPRGFPHEGESCGGSPSLHITVEILVRTWFDFISDALGALADRDMRFRKSVPISFLNDPKAKAELSEKFDMFKSTFSEGSTLEDAILKHIENVVVEKPPVPDGHFATLFQEITLNTSLEKRQINMTRIFQKEEIIGMQFSGNHIAGPEKIKPALAFIQSTDQFTPADLPGGLNSNEQLVLTKRLIKIGLLTLA